MKIVLYYGGNSNKRTEDYETLYRLLDRREIHLSRVPQRGEVLCLFIDDYCIDMEVSKVFVNYCPAGNKYIKSSAWGEWYGINVDNAEIVEEYV